MSDVFLINILEDQKLYLSVLLLYFQVIKNRHNNGQSV